MGTEKNQSVFRGHIWELGGKLPPPQFGVFDDWVMDFHAMPKSFWAPKRTIIQLDWTSETDTLKINLPQDREGYDGSETTYEKLSARRIQLCGDPSSIFIFWAIPHSWMRLVESSSTDVSGASEVPQSRGKLILKKPSCCVFAQKIISIVVKTYVFVAFLIPIYFSFLGSNWQWIYMYSFAFSMFAGQNLS